MSRFFGRRKATPVGAFFSGNMTCCRGRAGEGAFLFFFGQEDLFAGEKPLRGQSSRTEYFATVNHPTLDFATGHPTTPDFATGKPHNAGFCHQKTSQRWALAWENSDDCFRVGGRGLGQPREGPFSNSGMVRVAYPDLVPGCCISVSTN